MPKLVPIEDIVASEDIHVRVEGTSRAYAETLADVLRSGGKLSAVSVREVKGKGSVLTDGFATFEAHRLAGRTHVLANVRKGTWEDAIADSIGSNQGLRAMPLTTKDKRRAVILALWNLRSWSDRKIAAQVGVSHDLVARIHSEQGPAIRAMEAPSNNRQLDESSSSPSSEGQKRLGADDKWRAPKHQAPAAELPFVPGSATHYVPIQAPRVKPDVRLHHEGLPDVEGLLATLQDAINEAAVTMHCVETSGHEQMLRLLADLRTHWGAWSGRRMAM